MSFNLTQTKKLYDTIYSEADALFKKHNPCKFKNGCCAAARGEHPTVSNHCCMGCKHHNPKTGCTVKSLACKLWTCSRIRRDYPELDKAVRELNKLAWDARVPMDCRDSKKDSFLNSRFYEYKGLIAASQGGR